MKKMNWRPDRVFGLSYAPAALSGSGQPELVVTLEPGMGARAEQLILDRRFYTRTAYLEGNRERWPGHEPSLFEHERGRDFGFGACGYVTESDTGVSYHLPLAYETVEQVALTLQIFTFALTCIVSEGVDHEPKANRAQLLDLTTRCDRYAHAGYGHAVTGHIYPSFRLWLVRYATTLEATNGHAPEVEKAMAEVYRAIAHPRAHEFARECRARVNLEGRFLLECPGNACDIAIYPDGDYGGDGELPSKFSCHNLDAAEQQLTLLAGLAVLHDLAVEELG